MTCPLRQTTCPEQCRGPVRFEFDNVNTVEPVPMCRIEAAELFLGNMKSFARLLPVEIVSVVHDEVFFDEVSHRLHRGGVKAWRAHTAKQLAIEALIANEPNVIDIRDRLKVS